MAARAASVKSPVAEMPIATSAVGIRLAPFGTPVARAKAQARAKTEKRLDFEAGKCRICGCTDEKPCRMVPDPDVPIAGQAIVSCAWADESRTLCTNRKCLRQAEAK